MSKRNKTRRGISFGSLFMICLTVIVTAACCYVLPKLQGDTTVDLDVAQVIGSIDLSGAVPELSLSDIPIFSSTGSAANVDASTAVSLTPTPAPTVEPEVMASLTTPVSNAGSFTMTLGGSLCVEAGVRKSAYYSETKTYDFTELLSLLAPEMQSDLCLLPLENLIVPTAKNSDTVTPEAALSLLTSAGADIAAVGFTEAFDQGLDGITSTVSALKANGLTVIGAYATQEESATPVMRTAGNIKVAILHYTDGLTSAGAKKAKKADAAWAIPQADAAVIAADIQKARSAGAQAVIVSLHWGKLGKAAPTDAQTTLAQAIADSGADLIVGTGTKVVQPVVWLQGKDAAGQSKQVLCAYNLGTLLSDNRDKTAYIAGMLLQLRFTADAAGSVTIDRVEYTPTYAWRYKTGSQYQYRVLASDQPAPDAMNSDQQDTMSRALSTLQKELEGSVVTLRNK